MTVLVTGVSSFVGCHTALKLAASGFDVVGTITRPPDEYTQSPSARLKALRRAAVSLEQLDLAQAERIEATVNTHKPDVWVQVAGWTRGYSSPDFDLAAAMRVGAFSLPHVFAALARVGGRGVVLIGSVSEYSDSDEPHVEDEPCWPSTAYGLSKLMVTLRARQLASQYRVRARVARLFLPFGSLDNPSRLMAEVPRRLRRGEAVQLSPCEQRRDLLHIEEACQALETIVKHADRGDSFDVFNVCSGTSPRLRDVVLHMAARLGADPALCRFGDLPMRPGEPAMMAGSPAKAAEVLGWKPGDWKSGVDRYLDDLEAPPA